MDWLLRNPTLRFNEKFSLLTTVCLLIFLVQILSFPFCVKNIMILDVVFAETKLFIKKIAERKPQT